MAKYAMSPEKYEYLVENIDLLDLLLTEQIHKDMDIKIQPSDFAEFLTKSIFRMDKKGYGSIDENLFLWQQEFRQSLSFLEQNLNKTEDKGTQDKVLHFLNHLMGSLDMTMEENQRMLPILLEYVEYHKTLKQDHTKTR